MERNSAIDHAMEQKVGANHHVVSTAALCFCSFMNAYLVISVFPYAGYMVMELGGGKFTTANVGTYAGLLASSFMLGRTLSGVPWGKAADVYGRSDILQTCLLLSSVFSLLFGLSTSLRWALVWRLCLGLSNGLMSVVKTAATELADGNEVAERRTMGLVIGMRSWGYLLSPAIGGLLADPVGQYPSAVWLHQCWIGQVLAKYRFILPNLVASFGCFAAFGILKLFVRETLPGCRNVSNIPSDTVKWVRNKFRNRCMHRGNTGESKRLLAIKKDSGIDDANDATITEIADNDVSVWSCVVTRRHLVVHWMYSFVSMCADEMFPLFCMSQTGGLGLTEASIGKVLSGAGLLFAISQYAVFASLVHYFGEYTCLIIGSIVGVQPLLLIPLSLVLLQEGSSGHLSWSVFSLLSVVMAVCKLFGMLYFASLALAINKTVPKSQRGTMNGLVVTGASMVRSVAPTFSGTLTTISFSSMIFPSTYGSLLMFGTLSILGAFVTLRVRRLKLIRDGGVELENIDHSRV